MESLSNYYDSIPATSKQTARHVAGSAMWSPDILVSHACTLYYAMYNTTQTRLQLYNMHAWVFYKVDRSF